MNWWSSAYLDTPDPLLAGTLHGGGQFAGHDVTGIEPERSLCAMLIHASAFNLGLAMRKMTGCERRNTFIFALRLLLMASVRLASAMIVRTRDGSANRRDPLLLPFAPSGNRVAPQVDRVLRAVCTVGRFQADGANRKRDGRVHSRRQLTTSWGAPPSGHTIESDLVFLGRPLCHSRDRYGI